MLKKHLSSINMKTDLQAKQIAREETSLSINERGRSSFYRVIIDLAITLSPTSFLYAEYRRA